MQTVLFRYLEYVYSFTPVFPENKMPYPTWKRIFSMAHGSFWAIIISVAAVSHDANLFLAARAIGLLVRNVFEPKIRIAMSCQPFRLGLTSRVIFHLS